LKKPPVRGFFIGGLCSSAHAGSGQTGARQAPPGAKAQS